MLDVTSHLRCVDARDKVYALPNAAGSCFRESEADYTITLPMLLNKILRNMHSINRPSDLDTVRNQCALLENLFEETLRTASFLF
jgi:hypothetical protein